MKWLCFDIKINILEIVNKTMHRFKVEGNILKVAIARKLEINSRGLKYFLSDIPYKSLVDLSFVRSHKICRLRPGY